METTGLNFNILIKKEEDLVVAHGLELDIVATAGTAQQVKDEILDLIFVQVHYALRNDNLDNLSLWANCEVSRLAHIEPSTLRSLK